MKEQHDDLPPLPENVLTQVGHERRNVSVPADAQERLAARLALSLPGFSGGGSGGGNSEVATRSTAPSIAASVAPTKLVSAVIAAFVVGAGAGAGTYAAVSGAPSPKIVYVEKPAASVSPAIALEAPSTTPQSAPTISAVIEKPAIVSATSTASIAAKPDSRLREERILLDQARADVVDGKLNEALATLHQHQAKFPKGALAEEREALAIRALARLHRGDEARTRAERFMVLYPQSLLVEGVENDVRSIP